MKIKHLQIELDKNKIPSEMYSVVGGLWDERYCLENINGTWYVYYCERGKKMIIDEFENESDACVYFLNKLLDIYSMIKH